MSRIAVLDSLRAVDYRRSPLHSDTAIWSETNCYADLWIELLHALGLEPRAMLGFTVAIDFEGDQWTFFKPSHDDLYALYGIDVQELTVWRPLLDHAREFLAAGKLISVETDSHWLPDTAGTDYRTRHGKTTVVLNDLDVEGERLGYFHNAGYFELQGEDFRRLFRLDASADSTYLPLFAEFIRTDRLVRRDPGELGELASRSLYRWLDRRPKDNPVVRFAERFAADLPSLRERGLDHYHLWAFGTIRQLGSAAELTARHLEWLSSTGHSDHSLVGNDFLQLATGCKALILKGARAINGTRAFDAAAACSDLALHLQRGIDRLAASAG